VKEKENFEFLKENDYRQANSLHCVRFLLRAFQLYAIAFTELFAQYVQLHTVLHAQAAKTKGKTI